MTENFSLNISSRSLKEDLSSLFLLLSKNVTLDFYFSQLFLKSLEKNDQTEKKRSFGFFFKSFCSKIFLLAFYFDVVVVVVELPICFACFFFSASISFSFSISAMYFSTSSALSVFNGLCRIITAISTFFDPL